jgi:flagellar basal-body rod modification protein FlgD
MTTATATATNTSNSTSSLFGAQRTSATETKSASEDMQTRFLSLLMTQLKNQDPLNPTDANQMTAQLSQISTVSGIEKLNASMDKLLASYAGTQNMQAAAMIGKTVLVAGNGLALGENGAVGGVNLESAAQRVSVAIKDASGKVVLTQELNDAGEALAPGNYSFSVTASNGDNAVKVAALEAGMVNALTMTKDGVLLQLPNQKSVAYSDILQILN